MKFVNIWLGVSTDLQAIARESLTWDESTQGDYTGPLRNRSRRLFEYMQDVESRQRIFDTPTLGGRDYKLWSLDFEDDTSVLLLVEEEINHLATQYPNEIAILGAWKADGAMIGCTLVETEVPNPEYTGEPYEIPNPDYDPNYELSEGVENPDYDPRETIRNPAYVPEFLTERSQTGTPRVALAPQTWRFQESLGATSNADLVDGNLLLGQSPRIFS